MQVVRCIYKYKLNEKVLNYATKKNMGKINSYESQCISGSSKRACICLVVQTELFYPNKTLFQRFNTIYISYIQM